MQDADGIGEAVTGGAVARAVEPGHGEADDGRTQERNCLNCGCALIGAYCHCCGQRGHVHRTIAAWWHDFLHSVLHVDVKFWLTLGMLVWRPGELTRRYAHGERAKFISPLALFLLTVFLMFAVFSILGSAIFGSDPTGIQAEFAEEARTVEERIVQLERERAAAADAGRDDVVERFDRAIASEREDLETIRSIGEKGLPDTSKMTVSDDVPTWIREAAYKFAANPSLMLYKLQANAYKFSWALIPISVPFLWVLFLHRRRHRLEFTAYDHLVFITYSIAFMSLALVTLVLLGSIEVGGGVIASLTGIAFLLIPPLHMYRQLRQAYLLSRFSAAWRTFALLVFANIALGLFATLLLAIGALG